jgi:hypothetical protein
MEDSAVRFSANVRRDLKQNSEQQRLHRASTQCFSIHNGDLTRSLEQTVSEFHEDSNLIEQSGKTQEIQESFGNTLTKSRHWQSQKQQIGGKIEMGEERENQVQ